MELNNVNVKKNIFETWMERILLWRVYSACCAELGFKRVTKALAFTLWPNPKWKTAVPLLSRARGQACVSAQSGSARHRAERGLRLRDDLSPAGTRRHHHRSASRCLFQHPPCVPKRAGGKTWEANGGEALIQKKPFSLAQLYLGVSRPILPVSRRVPSLEK